MTPHKGIETARHALLRQFSESSRRQAGAQLTAQQLQAQELLAWARSRPDQAAPVRLEDLPPDRRVTAGTPVVLDGKTQYLTMVMDCGLKVLPTGVLVDASPVELLLAGEDELDTDAPVLDRAHALATIQLAAYGFSRPWCCCCAAPGTLQLLRHAFEGHEHPWPRAVLEQACIDKWEAMQPSLPLGVAMAPIPPELALPTH